MTFSTTALLPLVMQLGTYVKAAADHYANLREIGKNPDPDLIAAFIKVKLDEWDPKLQGKTLLDEATRSAGSRFLAGLVVNASK